MVTVLTSVMNRYESLKRSLTSWLALPEVEAVVIVDWSSSLAVKQRLEDSGIVDSRVRVIRVEGEKRWSITRSLNAGLKTVSSDRVLKLDADHQISADFFRLNNLERYDFFAGDWRTATPLQKHTNGALYAWTADLHSLSGWDPRIKGYGWDDSDLIERLASHGLFRKTFHRKTVRHSSHTDSARLANLGGSATLRPKQSVQLNRIIAWNRCPWIPELDKNPGNSTYYGPMISLGSLEETIRARTELQNSKASSLNTKLRHFLARFGMRVTQGWRDALRRIDARYGNRKNRVLVVHAYHGLGNRLRVLASAVLLAKVTRTKLVVVWLRDDHCKAGLKELFDYRGEVVESEDEVEEIARLRKVRFVNYLEDGLRSNKGHYFTRLGLGRITYVRSSSVLRHRYSTFPLISRVIRSWNPSPEVSLLVGQPGSFIVGIHCRSLVSLGLVGPRHELMHGNWNGDAQNSIAKARKATQPKDLVAALKKAIDGDSFAAVSPLSVYISSDSTESLAELEGSLPGNCLVQKEGEVAREREAGDVLWALAEAIRLSRAQLFIGSHYSSFSELVLFLRGNFGQPYSIIVGRD